MKNQYVSELAKHLIWDHFIAEAYINGPPPGMTGRRLAKLKTLIWHDGNFWFNMARAGLDTQYPIALKREKPEQYKDAMGNFYAMCLEIMHRMGLV